jgi:hypothetical protein
MKHLPLYLLLLGILVLLPKTKKAASAASQISQVTQSNAQKPTNKKNTLETKSGSAGLPLVKKQPTSASQPLLIDKIYEQQKN